MKLNELIFSIYKGTCATLPFCNTMVGRLMRQYAPLLSLTKEGHPGCEALPR